MKMKPVIDVFEAFGYDLKKPDELAFLEFVTRLYTERIERGLTAGELEKRMAAEKGRYYLDFDQRMKRAIRRIVEADPEALAYFGVYPKRRTVCGIAWALTDLLLHRS